MSLVVFSTISPLEQPGHLPNLLFSSWQVFPNQYSWEPQHEGLHGVVQCFLKHFLFQNRIFWDFPGSPVVKTLLPMQGTQLWSLIGELRCRIPRKWTWRLLSRVRLFATPWTIHTVHGILQARILEWVAYPFSSRSSRPRNWTWVFCIAGRFFTNWAMREVPRYWRKNVNLYADFWWHEGQCPWPLHCSSVICTWFCSFYFAFNIC